jgi:hypothetical protein
MLTVTQIDKFCYPIEYRIDRKKFQNSFYILLNRLNITYNDSSWFSINLTHLPNLQGKDRWQKHTGKHNIVKLEGVDEADFVEHLSEMKDLYIGQVIKDIQKQHTGIFQGRIQLVWLGPNASYPLHKDLHTTSRYHIPLITNENCYWIFEKNKKKYQLHMPVDNRVWFVDPTNILHTFINNSNTTRCHLIMTSGKD